jgi:hypothetical protein
MFITKGFRITPPTTTEKINSCSDEKCQGYEGGYHMGARFCQYCGKPMALRNKVKPIGNYRLSDLLAKCPIKIKCQDITAIAQPPVHVVYVNDTPKRKPDDPTQWQDCVELPDMIVDENALAIAEKWLSENGLNPQPIELLVKN